jgi:hypothetical protein
MDFYDRIDIFFMLSSKQRNIIIKIVLAEEESTKIPDEKNCPVMGIC